MFAPSRRGSSSIVVRSDDVERSMSKRVLATIPLPRCRRWHHPHHGVYGRTSATPSVSGMCGARKATPQNVLASRTRRSPSRPRYVEATPAASSTAAFTW